MTEHLKESVLKICGLMNVFVASHHKLVRKDQQLQKDLNALRVEINQYSDEIDELKRVRALLLKEGFKKKADEMRDRIDDLKALIYCVERDIRLNKASIRRNGEKLRNVNNEFRKATQVPLYTLIPGDSLIAIKNRNSHLKQMWGMMREPGQDQRALFTPTHYSIRWLFQHAII